MATGALTRREFLHVSGLAATAALVTGCAATPAEPAAPTTAPATVEPEATAEPIATVVEEAPARFSEAPSLADRVAAGELPPVEERLPREPVVVPVTEEIGQYGGTWHRVAVGPGDAGMVSSRLGYEPLFRWSENLQPTVPNIARAMEVNDDFTEFTFYLREGMKWSDGEPYTADDFVFYYEDGLMNADLSPTVSKFLRDPENDQPLVLEKIDDYSFRIRFQSPYGLFPQIVSADAVLDMCRWPKHYLSQFHPNYADEDELNAKVKEAGFEHWYQLFNDRRSWQNPDCPRIWPWVPTRVPPDVPVVCERNPYYWKVDPEGNQLPYLDVLQHDVVENADLANLKAVAGEIDMQFRHILWTNYPLFIENAEQGGYRVMQWILAEGTNFMLMPGLTHADPVMRELLRQLDFRVALSLGIDRPQIRELAYSGFGEPRQASLIPQSPYFKSEHASLHATLDVEGANALLDGMGLVDRDAEGFRLRPDGEGMTLGIEYAPVFGPWRDVAQLICDQWQEIGVRAVPREEDRTLLVERGAANERDFGVWTMDGCIVPLVDPYYFLPRSGGYNWGPDWGTWYESGRTAGEEPPEEVIQQCDLYDRIKGASESEIPVLAEEFFDNFSRNLWCIGVVGVLPHVGVVKNNFRNVPEEAISDWWLLTPGNTNIEQYFLRQE